MSDEKPFNELDFIAILPDKGKKFFAIRSEFEKLLKSLNGESVPEKQIYIEKYFRLTKAFRTFIEVTEKANSEIQDVLVNPDDFYRKGLDLTDFTSPETFISTLKKLLSPNYYPSDDPIDLVHDVNCVRVLYLLGGFGTYMPQSIFYKLDVAVYSLCLGLGFLSAMMQFSPREIRQRVKTLAGKKHQKSLTFDKILFAYKSLGAEWSEGDVRKPIILKGTKISINKLAREINIHLKGQLTERHISSCLRELRQNEEI